VVTTLFISEPTIKRPQETSYNTHDYLGFVGLFILSISAFVAVFIISANLELLQQFKTDLASLLTNKALASFTVETLRLSVAIVAATIVARIVIASRMVNSQMVDATYIAPIKDFFSRYNLKLALLLLALIGLYRISDIVLGVIANVFYQDLQYTKTEIATIVKSFGLVMTIVGGFLGGLLSLRYGVMKILFLGAILTVITNLLFILLAQVGHDTTLLYVVISADNLSAGLASAAFIAFLSSLTNIQFTAVQYAIFSSLMTLLPKVLGGYSGSIVDSVGYENFFIIASVMGLPILILVWLANKHLNISEFKLKDHAS
jgi:PAT family beta-lactamase induction signal transducer AmpG